MRGEVPADDGGDEGEKRMRTRRWTLGAVALVAFAMVASACSDVSSVRCRR
jgi:hypothetical protein